MSGKTPSLVYRPYVDGLRAVAILAVVGFHVFPGTYRGGFVGVDIFFVISGFLISSIIFEGLNKGSFSFVDFYARRIRRIFPALFLVLIFCWVVGWYFLLLDDYKSLGKHIAAAAVFVPNFVFWQETGYFDTDAIRKPLLHLWSLGIEEQYYLIWSPLAYLLWKRTSRALVAIVGVILISFALNVITASYNPSYAFYLPFTRFWELFLGSLIAYLHVRHRSQTEDILGRALYRKSSDPTVAITLRDAAATIGFVFILLAIFALSRRVAFPGWWALLPTVGTALLIVAGQQAIINRNILSARLLVFVGLISYPLYLWHWPLLSLTRIIKGENSKLQQVAIVAISFLLAWLTYALIEKRIRHGSNKGIWRYSPLILTTLMLSAGVLGLYTYVKEGFPERLPPAIVEMLKSPFSSEKSYRYKTCFLDPAFQGPGSFAPGCLDAELPNQRRPIVLLWGDSHGAHLYPGLRSVQQEKEAFRIAQYTGCSPLDDGGPSTKGKWCKQINGEIRRTIAELRPEAVILGARWSRDTVDLPGKLEGTVGFLRAQGTKRIILIGPPPSWNPDLKTAIAHYFFKNQSVPDRMNYGLGGFKGVKEMDSRLAEISKSLGLSYISAVSILCNPAGCLTKIGNMPDSLIAVDSDHYSEKGSIYLFNSIRPLLEFTPSGE